MMRTFVKFLTVIILFSYCNILFAAAVLEYRINGIEDPLKQNALAWLQVEQKQLGQPLTQKKIAVLREKAPTIIKGALSPYGYFEPKINSKLIRLSNGTQVLEYTINPGVPVKTDHIKVSIVGPGAKLKPFRNFIKQFPIKSGQVLDTETYNAQKKKLNTAATNAGFLDAKFVVNKIDVNLNTHKADITLKFDTGPQYYFGQVHFSPNPMDTSFLRRYLQFNPGQPYSPSALMKLQQDLSSTKYFKSVSVEPQQQNASNHQVPVDVTLAPGKYSQYNFGLGYGTDTGVRATVGWDLNRITPTGQYFTSYLQLSQVQSSLAAQYNIPGQDPLNENYFINASVFEQTPNSSTGFTQKVSVGKTELWWGWQTTYALALQFDQYDLREGPKQYSHLLLPSINFSRSKADDPVFPRNGYNVTLMARGAAEQLLSSTSFAQTELSAKYILSPSEKTRIVTRGNLGLTATDDVEKIPLSLQFFAGGADSVRGYDYQELGPGKYLLVGSLEFQYEVKKNWFAAVFTDAGNAVNSFSNPEDNVVGRNEPSIDLSDTLKYSIGIGALWASPVGPMEITLAQPMSDPDKSPMIQFTMGANL